MINSILYYFPRNNTVKWGYTPPGRLSVDRFINGSEAYWQQESREAVRQKRKLVLCDWALSSYSECEMDPYIQGLHKLLEDGFELYLWKNNSINKLSQSGVKGLKHQHNRAVSTIPDKKLLIQRMASQGVAADEVGILDHFACKQLFLGETTRCIDSLHVNRSDFELDVIISGLVKDHLPKVKLKRTCFGLDNRRFKYLLKKADIATSDEQIKYAKIKNDDDAETFLSKYHKKKQPFLKELDCSYSNISSATLAQILTKTPKIESIDLNWSKNIAGFFNLENFEKLNWSCLKKLDCSYSNISSATLAQILTKAPNIESIDLNGCKNIAGSFNSEDLEKLNLSSLKNLQCSFSNISSAMLAQILAKAPKIEFISLIECKNIAGSFNPDDFEKLNLSCLKNLDCRDSNINIAMLAQVLTKAPNIESINLHGSYDIADPFNPEDLEKLNLSSLKELNCSFSSISNAMLAQILTKAPKIESINLRGSYDIADPFNPEDIEKLNLSSLKKLDCGSSNISSAMLAQILAKAPNIESIDLRGCRNIAGSFNSEDLEKLNLSSLKKLDCGSSNISSAMLAQILAKAPKIESIDLSGCRNIADPFNPEDLEKLNLSSLKELDCRHSSISNAMLAQILTKAPKIESINLHGSYDIADPFNPEDLEKLNLSSLKNLQCGRSNISSATLAQILTKAPKIEFIDLHECENIAGSFNLEDIEELNLSCLKELYCRGSNINIATLAQILAKAPKIESINLNGCKNIAGSFNPEDIEELNLSGLKELVCEDSNISSAMLAQILAKAPKIESIDLSGCRNIADPFNPEDLEKLNLSCLKELVCEDSNISSATLAQILAKAPNIESIDLYRCKNLAGSFNPDDFEKLNLSCLKKLDCRRSNINIATLAQILTKAPKIESINLYGCKNLAGSFNPEDFEKLNLSYLKKLDCRDSNISITMLTQILAKAPNVRLEDSSSLKNVVRTPSMVSSRKPRKGLTQTVDAHTKNDPNSKSTATFVFEGKDGVHPGVRDYRLEVFYKLEINEGNCSKASAFTWHKDCSPKLTDCSDDIEWVESPEKMRALWENTSSPNNKYYYGIVDISPSEELIPLPSLSPNEEITHMCADVTIQYCAKDNFYFVKNKLRSAAKVHYIVRVPDPVLISDVFDKGIMELIEEFRGYSSGDLIIDSRFPTGTDYLKAIIDQKKGACRHRAVGFFSQVQKRFPEVPVRQINNMCHDFVELKHGDRWLRCDLGGVASDLHVSKVNHPNLAIRKIQISDRSSEKESINEYFDKHIVLYGKNSLVKVHSIDEFEACLAWMRRRFNKVSYVDQLEDLKLTSKNIREKSILVINLSTFDEAEIKKFTTSETRENLPQDTCIIGIYIIKGSFAKLTKDFLAYFHNKLELSSFCTSHLNPITSTVLKNTRGEQGGACESLKKQIKPKVKQEDTSTLLNRKILETLWGASSSLDNKFTLTFDKNNTPTNFSEFVENHVLSEGKNVHIAVNSKEELDLCSFWLQKHIDNAYYIDRPEDIRCSAKWIGDDGKLNPGPGGPLCSYIKSQKRTVFIINFNTFRADDLVRCNTIYDSENREADGVAIPEDACVIGLSVSSPQSYKGKDFTGRFHECLELSPFTAEYPVKFDDKLEAAVSIDLFGCSDWKEQLLGTWTIEGNNFKRKKGLLEKGYSSIEIQNGPWDNREFRLIWQQLLLRKEVSLKKTSTQDWEQFKNSVTWTNELPEGVSPVIINPLSLQEMIQRYQIIKGGHLKPLPGHIEAVENTALYAYVTAELNDGQWYRLLKHSKKHNVKLHILTSECVSNPITEEYKTVKLEASANILVCEDVDLTVSRLENVIEDAKVFDITECDNRVLSSMDALWVSDTEFRFKKIFGALHKALADKKHVILKGNFSADFIDALMPLILPVKNEFPYEGKLTLVTNSNKGFELFHASDQYPMDIDTKQEILPPLEFRIEGELHPFDKARLDLVCHSLEKAPQVYIEGATGVGKTTFIKKVLAKQPAFSVFFGMNAIVDWAESPDDKVLVLFIDETNLQNSQFTLFEGLYHKSKGILYEGQYYPLTDQHRVIFAGNPLDYGGERQEVSFLSRHKNTIKFMPLTNEYLVDRVLSPFKLPRKTANMFIEVYKKVPQLSPRELEMMALTALARPKINPSHAALRFARCALPNSEQQPFTDWFISRFGKVEAPNITKNVKDFVLTESRKEVYRILSDLFSVRNYRRNNSVSGGLGGIVLEGAPGDGKSHFAVAYLLSKGLKQVTPQDIGSFKGDAFCRLPANMPAEEKKECLLKAFHAGQWVVEDEINSSPSLESLHNALLMGFDEGGNRAKKQGFMLIGTQNPIYLAGRRATSLALKRRLITYEVSPYSQKEAYRILHKRYPSISQEVIRVLTRKKVPFRELLSLVEKGIDKPKVVLDPLPYMAEQHGQTSKLYALSAVMSWLYGKSLPASKRDIPNYKGDSLRSVAKAEGYTKIGEIYDPQYLVKLAKKYGFESTQVVETNCEDYIDTLKGLLDNKQAPVVFFDVEFGTGRPIKLNSQHEHAAVAVGYFYNLKSELFFTLLHWGKPWVVSAKELADSANNLSNDREPETFYKVNGVWRQLGDRSDSNSEDLRRLVDNKKYTKKISGNKSKDTFRNKLIVVS